MAWRTIISRSGGRIRRIVLRQRIDRRHGNGDKLPGTRDVGCAAAAGEQSVVADAVEPLGEDVEQEAPHEFVGRERHRAVLRPPIAAVVPVIKGHAALGKAD